MNIPKIDLIIYHKSKDTLAGVYLIRRYNGNYHKLNMCGVGIRMGINDISIDVKDKHVMIIGTSFDENTMNKLHEDAKFLLCIDRQNRAQCDLPFCITDIKRSTCQLVWDTLYPETQRPRYIDYIGGRNLWDFSKEFTREFTSGLYETIHAFNYSDDFCNFRFLEDFHGEDAEKHIKHYIEYGKTIVAKNQVITNRNCEKAFKCTIDGHSAYAVNIIYDGVLSDICNKLLVDHKCGISIGFGRSRKIGVWDVGLRSLKGSDIDVSKIAKIFNGGGHMNAAGFEYRGDIDELLMTVEL